MCSCEYVGIICIIVSPIMLTGMPRLFILEYVFYYGIMDRRIILAGDIFEFYFMFLLGVIMFVIGFIGKGMLPDLFYSLCLWAPFSVHLVKIIFININRYRDWDNMLLGNVIRNTFTISKGILLIK